MRNVIIASGALCGALAYAPFASAATISILAAADNTLCQDAAGGLSNGKGQHFFVGRTNDSTLRRAVLKFDIAAAIPAGSTINSASLTLAMSKTRGGLSTIGLHRVFTSWGEGTSDAGAEEGGCIASTTGDATWLHARFATTPWTTIGGDFNPAPSNSLGVNMAGSYTWTSTATAVADVQSWLDTPAANFGWLLRGNETADRNVKRFGSRESPPGSIVPTLLVDYTPGTTTACDLNQIDAVTLGPPVSPAKAADWVYTLDCGASVDTRIDPTYPVLGGVAAVNPATGASFGSSASGPARLMLFQRACGCTDVIKLVKNGAGAIRITF